MADSKTDFRLDAAGKMALLALLLSVFLGAIDATIVSTALPVIAREMHATTQLPWILSGFLLTSTIVMPFYGKLGDLWGRRNSLLLAQGIFTVGTMLCALSPGFYWLVAFRALQGLGAGGLLVLAMAGVGDIIPLQLRGRYQGGFGAVFALSSLLGPLLGGLLVSLSWHWVFLATVPISVLAGVLAWRFLPNRSREVVWDYLGSFWLLTVMLALFLATQVSDRWLGVLGLVVGFSGTRLWLHQHFEKIIPGELFRSRSFFLSVTISFFLGAVLLGTLSYIPVWLQDVRGISPVLSGVLLLPMLVAMMASSILGGQWTSRRQRYRALPLVGVPLAAGGILCLSQVVTGAFPWWMFFVATAFLGLGMGLTLQTLILSAQLASPKNHLGTATSTLSLFRTYGSAIGVAILGAVYTQSVAHLGVVHGIERFLFDATLVSGLILLFLAPLAYFLEEMRLLSARAEGDAP